LPENRWGNEEENAGAACTAGKLALPMLSLPEIPNIPLSCHSIVRELEKK
jgi:hypothetical protein